MTESAEQMPRLTQTVRGLASVRWAAGRRSFETSEEQLTRQRREEEGQQAEEDVG